ncbi:MAG TPA: acyltransferase [Acetobacteraceae bacterium]|nr:acyltransferase [Acetobacteraceae bacterium]
MTFEPPPCNAQAPPQATATTGLPPLNPLQAAWLDLLRGVAAQLVVVSHALSLAVSEFHLHRLSHFGVAVFFILSGFLITHTILERHERQGFSLREFVISRFARIFTPFVPAILLVALLDAVMLRSPHYIWHADYTPGTAIANLLMLQDFPLFQVLRHLRVPEQPWFFGPFGSARPFWTISIEWWIYVTVGVIAAMALSRRVTPVLLGVLAFAAIEPAYHVIAGAGNGLTLAWLFGGLLALARRNPGVRRSFMPRTRQGQGLLTIAGIAALVLAAARLYYTGGHVYDLHFLMLAGCALFAPVFGAEWPRGGVPGWMAVLRHLAFHSYSLYLIHLTIVVLMLATLETLMPLPVLIALMLLVSNVAAAAFAFAFETRHRAVRDWLLRRLDRSDGAVRR